MLLHAVATSQVWVMKVMNPLTQHAPQETLG
jgi:hypothetical protein